MGEIREVNPSMCRKIEMPGGESQRGLLVLPTEPPRFAGARASNTTALGMGYQMTDAGTSLFDQRLERRIRITPQLEHALIVRHRLLQRTAGF